MESPLLMCLVLIFEVGAAGGVTSCVAVFACICTWLQAAIQIITVTEDLCGQFVSHCFTLTTHHKPSPQSYVWYYLMNEAKEARGALDIFSLHILK